ncbi:uncharacterized protein KY384_002229 [Bacidia gigantensis]|uniref:uncharacterized protein n=1 Tax=Bacidia gigantensis TaxID=2732470 RepID=UPI001D054FC4|nr:uncharacterized protein KY384_002229 [Bacidia gigantensis]KAG8533446.1 hypothetical protein KY384_002229 [Bacidia gigantensis]
MPSKGKVSDGNGVAKSQEPQFDSNALLQLTQKIQDGFSKKATKGAKGAQPLHEKKPKLKNQNRSTERGGSIAKYGGDKQTRETQKIGEHAKKPQGKKRLRNGEEKESQDSLAANKQRAKEHKGDKRVHDQAAVKPDLRALVEELGGSEDDYKLVANVESESEHELTTSGEADGKLANDLKKFMSSLGLEKAKREASEETVETDDYDEENVEEDGQRQINGAHTPTQPITKQSKTTIKSPSNDHAKLILQPLSEWHAAGLAPIEQQSESRSSVHKDTVERLHTHAKSLLEKENQMFADSQRSASSSHQFYTTIMATGTLSDKISALTLSVQESPVHNMKALENLLGLARKRSRAQAVDVLVALKDLFGLGNLLPSDRKLHAFGANPCLHAVLASHEVQWTDKKQLPRPLTEAHLLLWAFEDWLKSMFFQMLQILESWCNDEVVFARSKSVDCVYSLLKEKPEQEANLLRLLVNKLGDSDKKVASKASFNILQLQTTHPFMKPIIIAAIESDLLFRPGQSLHARYYAVITLNQTVLSNKEENVAKKLIDIYFALFMKLLNDPLEPVSKAKEVKVASSVKINSKGEVQGGGGAPGKNALKKQAQNSKSTAAAEELREKMLSAVLTGVNRAIPYTNTNNDSFEKHVDTLFRITHSSNFNTSIQALLLIQQLQGATQSFSDRFYRTLYESLLDPRLLTSSKQAMYLNLLYRSLRSDLDVKRIKAFAKRLLQVISMHQPSFTCGAIYLLRELETVFPSLSNFVSQPEENLDDDEEVFRDVPDPLSTTQPPSKDALLTPAAHQRPSYDGRKRDPVHASASASTCWELHPLLHHFHPSVSLFSTRLLTPSIPMPPKPDLGANTLIHFLDRFVYKNPKAATKQTPLKGQSVMQPSAGGAKGSILVTSSKVGAVKGVGQNFTDEKFWKSEEGGVREDEVFFHRYFSTVQAKKERAKNKKARKEETKRRRDRADSEGSAEDDSGGEEEIWKALVGSRPEIGGDDDVDGEDDDEISELEDYDDSEGSIGDAGVEFHDSDAEENVDGQGSADAMDLDDNSEGALFDSKDELPDLPSAMPSDAGESKGKGRKRRKWLKDLPTFASVEEYGDMLGGDEEEG